MAKNKLQKFSDIPPQIQEAMEKEGVFLFPGELYVNSSGAIYRILRFKFQENYNDGYKERVFYQFAKDETLENWKEEIEESYSSFVDDIKRGNDFRLTDDWKKLKTLAISIYKGEATDKDLITNEYAEISNNDHALIGRATKEGLIAIRDAMELKRQRAGIVASFMNKEIERKKAALEKLTEGLYGAVALFQKQIEKLMRVITTIELYLGVGEELHQIGQGQLAPEYTPLCFRQQVLFIDEEVGIYENGGMDFTDIEKFDEWLMKDKNYCRIIPEEKGIVVLRPRRRRKDYGEGETAVFKNVIWNIENMKRTYFLIRNGENIYRIFTEKLVIPNRLFPLRNEMQELVNKMENETWDKRKEEIEDEMYQYRKLGLFMQGLIDRTEIFHPLPLPEIQLFKLHLIDPDGKFVRFIYDDELALPTGRKSFSNWWKDIDSKIQKGSRVLVTGIYHPDRGYISKKDFSDRFYLKRDNNGEIRNIPDLPKEGVYTVEEFCSSYRNKIRSSEYKELLNKYKDGVVLAERDEKGRIRYGGTDYKWKLIDHKLNYYKYGYVNNKLVAGQGDRNMYEVEYTEVLPHLTIKYNPGGKTTHGWGDWRGHERKNSVRFRIFPDDKFLINYDQIDLEDIDFYIYSRIDRRNYLYMLPVLMKIKKHRAEEIKREKEFMRFVFDRNKPKLTFLGDTALRKRIVQSVIWWKYKNQWKRPIEKDDTLALRMIEKRINSKNYDNLKTLDDE